MNIRRPKDSHRRMVEDCADIWRYHRKHGDHKTADIYRRLLQRLLWLEREQGYLTLEDQRQFMPSADLAWFFKPRKAYHDW